VHVDCGDVPFRLMGVPPKEYCPQGLAAEGLAAEGNIFIEKVPPQGLKASGFVSPNVRAEARSLHQCDGCPARGAVDLRMTNSVSNTYSAPFCRLSLSIFSKA